MQFLTFQKNMMNRFEWNSFNVDCSTFCHEILISICNEFIPWYISQIFFEF